MAEHPDPQAADAAGGTHRAAPADTHWLYLQLELADLSPVRSLLVDRLAPWSDAEPAVRRWFHLQYVDGTGTALRVRWEVADAERSRVTQALQDLLTVPEVLAVRERIYAPEIEKFGGQAGMETAHRIFCAGTRAAVRIHRLQTDPLVLGAALQLALTAALGEHRARTFLYHYAWYWSGRGAMGPLWADSVRSLAGHRVSGAALRSAATAVLGGETPLGSAAARDDAPVDPGAEPGRTLRAFADTFWAEVRALRAQDPVTAARLSEAFILHTHQHLIANRLGIVPAQEAWTARLLSVG